MAKQPRRHHYVPQFYLAGFTNTGKKDGRLHVLDQRQRRQWMDSVGDTAHKRDYHAVDLGPSVDRMGVEKKVGIIEGKQNAVLQRIIDERCLPFPGSETFADLMGFVALMAVRVPFIRDRISKFIDEASKKQLFATFSTQQGRAAFRQVLKDHLDEMPPEQRAMAKECIENDTELDEMAKFACGNNYTVNYEQTWDVQTMLTNSITLMPILAQRNWALWIAGGDVPDCVCSDCPASLNWISDMGTLYPPGYGLANTIVSVPLNRRVVLVGTFEPLPSQQAVGAEVVAGVNTATVMYANQVFSPEQDFVWLMRDRTIGRVADLLAALESACPDDE